MGSKTKNLGTLLIEISLISILTLTALFKVEGTTIDDLAWWQWMMGFILFFGLSMMALKNYRSKNN